MHGPTSKGQPSLSKEMMRIYKEEGVRAFWKGNAVTIVHRLPYSALNFFSYEKYKSVRPAGLSPLIPGDLLFLMNVEKRF